MMEAVQPTSGRLDDEAPVVEVDDPLSDARALQILATEHWGLLAARSMSWNEAFSRASMFLSTVSGAVVALALVGQGTNFGPGFVTFALVLLPVVLFVGAATLARLTQVNNDDGRMIQGMNRIRHAYVTMVPGVEPYLSLPHFDDPASIARVYALPGNFNPVVQGLVTTPAIVATVTAVVAGALAAIVVAQVTSVGVVVVAGGIGGFIASFVAMAMYGRRAVMRSIAQVEVRFPPT
ncbi:MAG: hypothetical protein ABI573_09605 [Chloroflexota bacterium]